MGRARHPGVRDLVWMVPKIGRKGRGGPTDVMYLCVHGKSGRNACDEDAAATSEPEETRGLLLAAVCAAGI